MADADVALLAPLGREEVEELLLAAGRRPHVRVGARLVQVSEVPTAPEALEALLRELAPPEVREALAEPGRVSRRPFTCEREGIGRLRVQSLRDRLGPVLVLRRIPRKPASLDKLGLPDAVRAFLGHGRGLVIAAGGPGSGKTAALAAMVDALNSPRSGPSRLVVTVEEPIEYLHESRGALVVQLEAGVHCEDLAAGVRSGLSMGADAILAGALDGLATAEAILDAVGAGALVLVEIAAGSVVAALDHLLGLYPPERLPAARAALAGAFAGGFSVRRLPRVDGGGAASAYEVLVSTPTVAAAIRESGASGLAGLGERAWATTLDSALLELVGSGVVAAIDAAQASQSEPEFLRRCEAEGIAIGPAERPGTRDSGLEARQPEEASDVASGAAVGRAFGGASPEEPPPVPPPIVPGAQPQVPDSTPGSGRGEGAGSLYAAPPAPPRAKPFATRRLSRSEMLLGGAADGTRSRGRTTPSGADGRAPTGVEARAAPRQFLDPRAVAGRKVLVVDDDDSVRELVARILRSAGADVTTLGEPGRALEVLKASRFDLVLFDIMMPEFTGTELYDSTVEARPELRERILFITAHDLDEQLTVRIAARGGKVIRKPFSADDLLRAAAFALAEPPGASTANPDEL